MEKIIQGQRNWNEFESSDRIGVITTFFSEQYLSKSYELVSLSHENYVDEIKLNKIDTVFIDNDLFETDHEWFKENRGYLINYLKNNNINICVIKNTKKDISNLFKKAFIIYINPEIEDYKFSNYLIEMPILLNYMHFNPIDTSLEKDIIYLNYGSSNYNLKNLNLHQIENLTIENYTIKNINRKFLMKFFESIKNTKILFIKHPVFLDEITLKYIEYICYLSSTYIIYGHKNNLDKNLFFIDDFYSQNNKITMFLKNPDYLFKKILYKQRATFRTKSLLIKQDFNGFLELKVPKDYLPKISVITSTNKKGVLTDYFYRMSKQKNVDIEINLITHGFCLSDDESIKLKNTYDFPINIEKVSSEINLGECLNTAVNMSTYPVLAKIDDDDFYLENYLFDQWSSLQYSKAELVGKATIHFYFESNNIIALNNIGNSQKYNTFVFGATLMANDFTMKSIKFEDVMAGEDTKFINKILDNGGKIYSNHPYEFCAYRSNDKKNHTWLVNDLSILKNSLISGYGRPEPHVST